MILVVFRSRLQAEAAAAYQEMAQRIAPLASSMPGYISHKAFTAPDGERVTLVEYESEDALQAWSRHPDHREAKAAGRRSFFESYRVQICKVLKDRGAARPTPAETKTPKRQSPGAFDLMLMLRRRRWQRI